MKIQVFLNVKVKISLVFQELRAMNDYLECGYQLYFWRTKNGDYLKPAYHILCTAFCLIS